MNKYPVARAHAIALRASSADAPKAEVASAAPSGRRQSLHEVLVAKPK